MNTVMTTHGLIDIECLQVSDVVEVGDNYRKVATEYHLGDELVRRDVTVTALRGLETTSVQGKIGG